MSGTFPCPYCGNILQHSQEFAGQVVRCPDCGSQLQMPLFLSSAGGERRTSVKQRASMPSVTAAVLVGGALSMFVLLCLCTGILTSLDGESDVQQVAEAIEQFKPEEGSSDYQRSEKAESPYSERTKTLMTKWIKAKAVLLELNATSRLPFDSPEQLMCRALIERDQLIARQLQQDGELYDQGALPDQVGETSATLIEDFHRSTKDLVRDVKQNHPQSYRRRWDDFAD